MNVREKIDFYKYLMEKKYFFLKNFNQYLEKRNCENKHKENGFDKITNLKKKEELSDKIVSYDDFNIILKNIGEINDKYLLEEEVIQQLYQVLSQKQEGKVSIEGVEALILQCLLEQQNQIVQSQQQQNNVDLLEIKSMDHQISEEKIISTYDKLNLNEINELLIIYKKTIVLNKIQDKEKCELSLLVKQIENMNKKNSLSIQKEQAINILTILSQQVKDDSKLYVFNQILQQYQSKFENYLLLHEYGNQHVENYDQAHIFHESDEEDEIQNDLHAANRSKTHFENIHNQSNEHKIAELHTLNQEAQNISQIHSLVNIPCNQFDSLQKWYQNYVSEIQSHLNLNQLNSMFEILVEQEESSKNKFEKFENYYKKYKMIQTIYCN